MARALLIAEGLLRERTSAPVIEDSDSSEGGSDSELDLTGLEDHAPSCDYPTQQAPPPKAAQKPQQTRQPQQPLKAPQLPQAPNDPINITAPPNNSTRTIPTAPRLAGTARQPRGRGSASHAKRLRLVIGLTRSQAIGTLVPLSQHGTAPYTASRLEKDVNRGWLRWASPTPNNSQPQGGGRGGGWGGGEAVGH